MDNFIPAAWAKPKNIFAGTSLRTGGISKKPFASNNLALHVGDDKANVLTNRACLVKALKLPDQLIWLNQTHSNICIQMDDANITYTADAIVATNKLTVLNVMTADCLPILICNDKGTEIAAIHAGWRGLLHGIIENTIKCLKSSPNELIVWFGPTICESCFEVGEEIRSFFIKKHPLLQSAFYKKKYKLLASLVKIAEYILNSLHITKIYHSNLCTYEDSSQFYSYRRDGQTGRMTNLIWFT